MIKFKQKYIDHLDNGKIILRVGNDTDTDAREKGIEIKRKVVKLKNGIWMTESESEKENEKPFKDYLENLSSQESGEILDEEDSLDEQPVPSESRPEPFMI